METSTTVLSAHAQKIIAYLKEKAAGSDQFQAINKSQFDELPLDKFFGVLAELKASGLVVFYQEYVYKPYENFGDMTPKQYSKMDILLKLS